MEASAIGISDPRPANSFFAVGGVRVGIEIPLAHHVSVRLAVDGLAVLTPTSIELTSSSQTNQVIWTSPPLAFLAGTAVAYDFL
jgi:hypothetical protein